MWTCRWEGSRWDRQVKARRESGRGRSDHGLTWAGGVGEGAHPKSHMRHTGARTRGQHSPMFEHAGARDGGRTHSDTRTLRALRTPQPCARVWLWRRRGVSWGEAGAGGAYLERRRGRRDGEAPHTAPPPSRSLSLASCPRSSRLAPHAGEDCAAPRRRGRPHGDRGGAGRGGKRRRRQDREWGAGRGAASVGRRVGLIKHCLYTD